jgi:hypothetical protein
MYLPGSSEPQSLELLAGVSAPFMPTEMHDITRGRLLSRMNKPLSAIEVLCTHYAPIGNPDSVSSSHALDLLADIWAETPDTKDNAVKALELLSQKYDPIRANYWNHRRLLLQKAA